MRTNVCAQDMLHGMSNMFMHSLSKSEYLLREHACSQPVQNCVPCSHVQYGSVIIIIIFIIFIIIIPYCHLHKISGLRLSPLLSHTLVHCHTTLPHG